MALLSGIHLTEGPAGPAHCLPGPREAQEEQQSPECAGCRPPSRAARLPPWDPAARGGRGKAQRWRCSLCQAPCTPEPSRAPHHWAVSTWALLTHAAVRGLLKAVAGVAGVGGESSCGRPLSSSHCLGDGRAVLTPLPGPAAPYAPSSPPLGPCSPWRPAAGASVSTGGVRARRRGRWRGRPRLHLPV